MKKTNRQPESIKDRSRTAKVNIEFAGGAYRHHKLTQPDPLFASESLSERVDSVLDRLDKAGVRPYRSPENSKLKKRKIIATAAGTIALFAGAYGLGKIAPEGSQPPSPANMTEFSGDPLQVQYDISPESFRIIGGELQQIPNEHLGTGAEG